MITLTYIKKVSRFNRLILSIMTIGLSTALSSCGDDNDSKIPFFSMKDVEGSYSGKMTDTRSMSLKSNNGKVTPEGIDVHAEVKDNYIYLNKFPVNDLITSIVGIEKAPAIIEAIGEVNYKTEYEAKFNTEKNSIDMQLKPKPLELNLKHPIKMTGEEKPLETIKVTIISETEKGGRFTFESKKLEFSLIATEVLVNEQPFNFTTTTFMFDLNKK